MLDGVYTRPDPRRPPLFHATAAPTDQDIADILLTVRVKTLRLLQRRGLAPTEPAGEVICTRRRRGGSVLPLLLGQHRASRGGRVPAQLLRHLRGPVIVLFDNARIHTTSQVRALARRHPRLHLGHFPGYAPELDPDEEVWTLAKRALANGRPNSLAVLVADVVTQLERLRRAPRLLRACIMQSELPFRVP